MMCRAKACIRLCVPCAAVLWFDVGLYCAAKRCKRFVVVWSMDVCVG